MPIPPVVSLLAIAAVHAVWPASAVAAATTVPGTAGLTGDVDRSEAMRAGMERFLDREQQTAASRRAERWQRDPASREAYAASVAENRARFAKIIGAVDARVAEPEPQYSYVFAPEPDMFDFRLGLTFGHGEMAAMIAPRAFMVERGHADGVGADEMVAFEYAKVRRLYNQLRIPRQTGIEFFDGVHEIHGAGTFDFLQRHFDWPAANIPR